MLFQEENVYVPFSAKAQRSAAATYYKKNSLAKYLFVKKKIYRRPRYHTTYRNEMEKNPCSYFVYSWEVRPQLVEVFFDEINRIYLFTLSTFLDSIKRRTAKIRNWHETKRNMEHKIKKDIVTIYVLSWISAA